MAILTDEAKSWLLGAARRCIAARLRGESPPAEPPGDEALKEPCGAFVTLHIGSNLRGCIGLMEAGKPLWETVSEMAQAAAFEDHRFGPLSQEEYEGISLEISVLTPMEKIADLELIEPGEHGLMVSDGFRRGVLLPQVATNYGWDREEFLSHTCMKAGMAPDAWKGGIEVRIFRAEVFSEEELGLLNQPA